MGLTLVTKKLNMVYEMNP